jgi:hypothetical protein
MGIVTTSSATAFSYSPEIVYDFVTDPTNWTRTCPASPRIGGLPGPSPLRVGDTWTEAHPEKDRVFTWQLAIAIRPRMFVFTSMSNLSHDSHGNGGFEGRMTISYQFTQPGEDVTLFNRSMTIESYRNTPLHDGFFRMANPAYIDGYHAGIARELDARSVDAR